MGRQGGDGVDEVRWVGPRHRDDDVDPAEAGPPPTAVGEEEEGE